MNNFSQSPPGTAPAVNAAAAESSLFFDSSSVDAKPIIVTATAADSRKASHDAAAITVTTSLSQCDGQAAPGAGEGEDEEDVMTTATKVIFALAAFISAGSVGATIASMLLPFASKTTTLTSPASSSTLEEISLFQVCNTTTSASSTSSVVCRSTAQPCRDYLPFLVLATGSMSCAMLLTVMLLFILSLLCTNTWPNSKKRRAVFFSIVFASFAMVLSLGPVIGFALALFVSDPCRNGKPLFQHGNFTPGVAFYLTIAAAALNVLQLIVLLCCGGSANLAASACVEQMHKENREEAIERVIVASSRRRVTRSSLGSGQASPNAGSLALPAAFVPPLALSPRSVSQRPDDLFHRSGSINNSSAFIVDYNDSANQVALSPTNPLTYRGSSFVPPDAVPLPLDEKGINEMVYASATVSRSASSLNDQQHQTVSAGAAAPGGADDDQEGDRSSSSRGKSRGGVTTIKIRTLKTVKKST